MSRRRRLSRQEADSEDDGEEESEDEEEKYLIGMVDVSIVGLQHYHGTVSSREMVCLMREPQNPYDGNAIRVNNMRGEQVGHVERAKACILAPLVDQKLAVIEGIVPSTGKSKFKMPCQVLVFCKVEAADAVRAALKTSLQQGPSIGEEAHAGSQSRVSEFLRGKVKGKEAEEGRKKVDMDDVFQMLSQCRDAQERYVAEPSGVVTSAMYEHQKEALAWLISRENSSELPPFWEEVRKGRGGQKVEYRNTITNFSTVDRPQPLRGGILADDMGLGKTLALLALIVTNRPGAGNISLAPVSHSSDSAKPEEPDVEGSRPSKKRKLEATKPPKLSAKGKTRAMGSEGNTSGAVTPLSLSAPALDGPKGTLIICPVSVLGNWVTQLEEHTAPGHLGVYLYHGSDRSATGGRRLDDFDIVLTSYSIVSAEGTERRAPLQQVRWLRIILDEAHIIRNPSAKQTKAVVALRADRKWAVTGTPIQNSTLDLFTFMTFLGLQPFDDRSFWNRTIQRPLQKGELSGFTRLQGLMTAIALRRTKETEINGKRLVELPRKTISIHRVHLLQEDRELYDKMEWEGREAVMGLLNSGRILQNYATALQFILRLRQICDHSALCPDYFPILSVNSAGDSASASPELLQKLLAVLQSGDEFDCPICLQPPSMAIITKCAHVYCRTCIEKSLVRDKQQCPLCRSPLTSADLVMAPSEDKDTSLAGRAEKSSAKINELIKLIIKDRDKDPSVKSVVFSQFNQMLNQIEGPLEKAGIKFVRLDGSMAASKRMQAQRSFESKEIGGPTVFLLSVKAAGVGLNLVAACRVYMMDPWWNPAVEEQAMDRVHRLGQTRDVQVVRFIVTDSIEERILQLQEKKRVLASTALDKKSLDQQREMCINDVRLLMGISQ